jgi:cytochrome c peroxidase
MKPLKKLAFCLLTLSLSFNVKARDKAFVEQQLGRLLFQDKNFSLNRNQACITCHNFRATGYNRMLVQATPTFADPLNVKNGSAVSKGSSAGAQGTLNTPSIGYAMYSPEFYWDDSEGLFIGGQFWNGRAKNLIEQAKLPLLNPIEMATSDNFAVIARLKEQFAYKALFQYLYQLNLDDIPSVRPAASDKTAWARIDTAYHKLATAIAAFERTPEINKFNSKFDYVTAGMTHYTPLEQKGFELFVDPAKGNCAACHVMDTKMNDDGTIVPPMFTDFTYDNIGTPRNVNIPGNPKPNLGLRGRKDIQVLDPNGDELGKHKVMSLRNIAITPPYGHNGIFTTLEQITHFYNTRDTLGKVTDNTDPGFGITGWPKPEIPQNVNRDELGNLGLTAEEEKAIVAFMKTLTDDYPLWGNDPNIPPNTPSPYISVAR